MLKSKTGKRKIRAGAKKIASQKTHKPAAVVQAEETPGKTLQKETYIEAVGRRKTAIARVRLFRNKSGIEVNGKDYKVYFPYPMWQLIVEDPSKVVQTKERYGVSAKVFGGGIRAQAEALRHALARALVKIDKGFRPQLKKLGYLKRDPRMKERRKYGLKKARRAPQWAKR